MLTVTVQNDTLAFSLEGHTYVASDCLFVWNDESVLTVKVDDITGAYMSPLSGLILDIK